MKRLLASLLALAMVLGVCLFAGCGGNGNDTTTTKAPTQATTTAGNNTTETTTAGGSTTETTTAGEDKPVETTTEAGPEIVVFDGTQQLPGYEDVDFRGKTFTIAGYKDAPDGFNNAKEVYSAEDTDSIAVAAKERNQYVEKLYNCKIAFNGSDNPGGLVSAEITSGKQTIDIWVGKYVVGSSATSGNNYNLYSLGMDMTADWWDQNYVHQNTIKNSAGTDTLYSIVGDFTFSASSLAHALMFNKTLYENKIASKGYDIYQLVRDGKWTMDIFEEMVKTAAEEVSGNDTLKYSEGDILGWATTSHATHGLHAASGLRMFDTVNGKFTMLMKDQAAEWNTIIDKAIQIWALPQRETTGYSNGQAALVSGNTLFYSDIIQKLEESTLRSATEARIGLVPYPKYSEAQENYAHYVDNHLMVYMVPTSVVEIEELGDFFTVYAAHSTALVRPVWIDAYAYDYCGDADSAEMLEIILNTRSYDPGYLVFNFEGEVSQQIDSGKNNITRLIDRRYDTYAGPGGSIEKHIAGIDDNKA